MEIIRVSLEIENTYEWYPAVTTYATNEVVEAPADYREETLAEWAYDELYPFTGVGHTDGKSWYDVTITACSDPELIGRTFNFGY